MSKKDIENRAKQILMDHGLYGVPVDPLKKNRVREQFLLIFAIKIIACRSRLLSLNLHVENN
jgi:hypothetical protein